MKSLIISEKDKIAAIMENERAIEFFVHKGDLLLGDIYTAKVENIMPSIDAAFVNLGNNRMGFLHASDIPGQGRLEDRIQPNQKLLIQIVKEPTGNKGPRVNISITLPGRFLVMTTENTNISISRKIVDYQERNRLKAIVTLLKPPGVGVVIRTEADGKDEYDLEEDFKMLWDNWKNISDKHENHKYPGLVYRDQDFIYRVVRDAYTAEIDQIIVDTTYGQTRTGQLLKNWTGKDVEIIQHKDGNILSSYGVEREIRNALETRINLPSGGYLFIQTTEAMTVVDVNSGKFTSSRTLRETVVKTNLESAHEIARQLKLRNIGGVIVVDFIDMDARQDRITVLEAFENALSTDKSKPQIGQLSDLGLVELTRRRQGQSLMEIFSRQCSHCNGKGLIVNISSGDSTRDRDRDSSNGRRGDRDRDRRDWHRGRQDHKPRHSMQKQDSEETQEETQTDTRVETKLEEAPPETDEDIPEDNNEEGIEDIENEFDDDSENEDEESGEFDESYEQERKYNVKEEDVSGVFTLSPKESEENE
ncbi:MAG: Rne/Rng family ribonuclease [Candidatus Melainabacteria bacterium]|nr:Rne/Rng family ribonuclease [Candidatus Melainabacteria bacterium]